MHEPPYRTKNMMPGMIMLWYGSVESIPSGWHLCDGTMGTPDLRDKFIVGAGDTHNPGDTGGQDSQTHTLTTDGHFHGLPFGAIVQEGAALDKYTTSRTDTATTDPADNRPAFYALCWIMKL